MHHQTAFPNHAPLPVNRPPEAMLDCLPCATPDDAPWWVTSSQEPLRSTATEATVADAAPAAVAEEPWWVTPPPEALPRAAEPTAPPAAEPAHAPVRAASNRKRRSLAWACVIAGILCFAGAGGALALICLTATEPGAAPATEGATVKPPPAVTPIPLKGQPAAKPKATAPAPKAPAPAQQLAAQRPRRPEAAGPGGVPEPPADKPPPPGPDAPKAAEVKPPTPPDPQVARLLKELQSPARPERLAAMYALASRGTGGKEAVPVLVERLRSYPKEEADLATRALAQIGWPAVPALVPALDDPSPPVRLRALWALAVLGPDARAAVQPVGACLQDDDPRVRLLAAQTLTAMGPHARPAVPLLAKALRDPDAGVRLQAAWALHAVGTDTLGQLLAVLQDGDAAVRLSAVQGLAAFAERPEALEALAGALQHSDATVRAIAAGMLVRLGPQAEAVLPELLLDLKKGDRTLQTHAFAAIFAIGTPPTDALREELAALNTTEGLGWAPVELTAAQRKAEVKRLVALLNDPNPTRRLAAVLALAQLGPEAKAAVPALGNALGREQHRGVLAGLLVALPALDPSFKMPAKTPEMFLAEIRQGFKAADTLDADELVRFYLLTATLSRPRLLDGRREPKLPEAVRQARDWAAQTIDALPPTPAALDALVRGINLTAEFNLGFTEPFTHLYTRLRALARQAKDVETLAYALEHLGEGVPATSPLLPPLRLAVYEVVIHPAWLDRMIAVRQGWLLEVATLKAQQKLRQQQQLLLAMQRLQATSGSTVQPKVPSWYEQWDKMIHPKPRLIDEIWTQPVTVYPWNLASDSAATTLGGPSRSFISAWGLKYHSGTLTNQPAAFNPYWQLFEAKVSYTGAVSGTIITVVPQVSDPPKPRRDAGPVKPHPGTYGAVNTEIATTARRFAQAAQHERPTQHDHSAKVTELSPPTRRTSTATTQVVYSYPGRPAQGVPVLDLPTLIRKTEQELAVLLVLKKQATLTPIRDELAKLAKEDQPAFLDKLQDKDPGVRLVTAALVGQLRLPAARLLLPLLADPVVEVREAAHQAMVSLARGTDLGPFLTDPPARLLQAIERWHTWLESQEPYPPTISVPASASPAVNQVPVDRK
jgi:HEAT repeat protein